jgi:hypothetical protein
MFEVSVQINVVKGASEYSDEQTKDGLSGQTPYANQQRSPSHISERMAACRVGPVNDDREKSVPGWG